MKPYYTFDTLEQSLKLQQSGFSKDQAKGLVEVIAVSHINLATKQDLADLETRIKSDLKEDMRKGFNEVDKRFQEIDKQMLHLENKIVRMTISLGSVVVATMGLCTFFLNS